MCGHASADLLAVAACNAVGPTIKVGGLDSKLGERDPDLRSVLHAMFQRVDHEEALREPEHLTHPWQVDVGVHLERFGDGDQLVARAHHHLLQTFETRPLALAAQLTLVLAPFGPEDESLLRTRNVEQELTHRSR